MNKKGQKALIGFALMTVFFVVALVLFGLIDPLKEALDTNRGDASLNCPGTASYNDSAYVIQSDFQKLVRRPTCFVTGQYMYFFVGIMIVSGIAWVYRNWRRTGGTR